MSCDCDTHNAASKRAAELLQALRLTGEKLDIAYRVVNDEEHTEPAKDPGV